MIRSSKNNKIQLAVVATSLALAITGCGGSASSEADSAPEANEVKSQLDQKLHDSLPDEIKQAGKIRIGSPTSSAPYITKPGNDVVGLIPDLAEEVGTVLGVEMEFVETPFPGLIPGLQANRLDVAWTTMNDTVEREEVLDFVNWIRTSAGFMVPAGNPHQISGIEDLCGLKAGTLRGSGQAKLLEEQTAKCQEEGQPAIDIKLYDDSGSAQAQLRSKQVDTFFGENTSLKYISEQVDGGKVFEVAEKTYLGGAFGIAVPKEQPELASALEQALKTVEGNGAYGAILEEYAAEGDALTQEEFQINGVGAGAFE